MKGITRQKLIVAKPFGGIGNRLRVISSLLWLKQKFDCHLKVIWLENEELGATYYDLFEASNEFEVVDSLGKYSRLKTSKQKSFVRGILAKAINRTLGVDYCVFDSDMYLGLDHVVDIVRKNQVIFFNTCEELLKWDKGLSEIRLSSPIKTKLETLSIALGLDSNTIGVHIRRTDHTFAIDRSPVRLFEDNIARELQMDPQLKFYLASDDPEIVRHFKVLFGEAIVAMEKEYGRSTKEGVVDAIIELFLLSKTRRILGSYWSSYSKMAGRLSGIPVEILDVKL